MCTPGESGAAGEQPASEAPLIQDVLGRVVRELVESGRAASTLNCASAGSSPPLELVSLGACHDDRCGRLQPRSTLKRCSACKKMYYCSSECQLHHWRHGHKEKCKDIQEINAAFGGT